ncbi:hypothetical protein CK203_075993 [Vitis vinifera]|uniref:Uncharacterized protein n=1 Tax=Vitis vinifera TaxID=29760 RepID=A0A438C1M6_VITVI|nr:hypothetical protein CK203_075993 [Vitis vinifera]
MSSKKKSASSARVGDAHEKSTDKLSVKEFRDRFCIPNGVIVELLNGEDVVSTEKLNKIPSSSPRNNSTRGSGSPAGVVHGIPPFHQDSTRLHSSQYHPGADGMQHHQHAPVRAPALPSIGDGTARLDEGRGEGTGDGPGCVGGVEASGEALLSKLLLSDSGGHLVDWVEKASFACLSKLFEIDAKERQCKTLLTARNLMAVVREPQEYVINILPRKMPKEVVPGEHYTVKDLPIYQALKEADAEKRQRSWIIGRRRKTKGPFGRLPDRNAAQTLLQIKLQLKEEAGEEWEGVKELTPPREFAPPPIIHEAEVIIEEPVNPAPHSISSGSGHVAGLNHSSTSLAAVARLANLADEAASINHPDSLLRMSMQLKPFARPDGGSRGRKPESAL